MSLPRTHNCARLPLRLPAELLADLRAHAAARGETLSALCRRALEGQVARDRLTDRVQAAHEAFRDGVFVDPEFPLAHPKE